MGARNYQTEKNLKYKKHASQNVISDYLTRASLSSQFKLVSLLEFFVFMSSVHI
jgi:hypothetical protein